MTPYLSKSGNYLGSPPVLAWIVHVAIVVATVAITVVRKPIQDDALHRQGVVERYVISPLSTWDGAWYIRIARHGYDQQQATAAFWPLYPLLLDVGNALTGIPYAPIGVAFSNVFFLVALICLFRLVKLDYGREVAGRAVWLAALSPLAFFFSTVYTEALFLMLTVGALVLAQGGQWTLAAVA